MTKRALIVAVDNYTYQLDITGCVNSGNQWKTYFTSKGYNTITTLYNTAATKSAIISKLNAMCTITAAADTLAVVLIGHGGQFTDNGTDETVDHLDEVYAPVNTTLAGANVIRDDELKLYLAKASAAAIVEVVVDSCHSGTMIDRTTTSPWTLWSACSPAELSGHGTWSGIDYRLYSYILVYALTNATSGTRQDFTDYIATTLASWGVTSQTPQLECTDAKRAGVPFT